MDDLTKFREILTRKPFKRVLPDGYLLHDRISGADDQNEPEDTLLYQVVTQADFMREYDPRGHAINSPIFYPDIVKKDPETGKMYKEEVVRCSFAFQKVIATKHIIHLCGNDTQFELPDSERNEANQKKMLEFRKGWTDSNMEIHRYEAIKSLKITGDGALVGFFANGKFGCKCLSYLNGDTLYPHYDSITGDLKLFARRYYDYDGDTGQANTEWVEVWDNQYLYRYKRNYGSTRSAIQVIKDLFGLNGYELVEQKRHGFNFVPVAYCRDEKGACWSNSQDSIEKYELAFSQLSQNNQAFAFPIMYLKGEEIEINGNDLDGSVKVITMGKDDEAGFLQKQDASGSFATQLEKLYKMIYEQSFAVIPPELKSGDLPGVAVKLLYSPAYENAMRDADELNPFIDQMVRIFKYGYGLASGKFIDMMQFRVNAWIEPYYHKSASEIVTNLATAVQNGFISKQTASERCPDYPMNGEIDRVIREDIEKRELNLKYAIAEQEKQMEINVEKERQLAKFSVKNSTGYGSGETRVRHTDSNGNWPDENNWTEWNQNH